jgi:UDPglucose--hexose-1-phosphate uridylyltransferase
MHESIPFGNWEKRWHPLRREWVVYAAHRNSRPWNFEKKESLSTAPVYDPKCYLCPGNKRISGLVNPAYENVFIFENDHPVVGLNAPPIPAEFQGQHDNLYKKGSLFLLCCFNRLAFLTNSCTFTTTAT